MPQLEQKPLSMGEHEGLKRAAGVIPLHTPMTIALQKGLAEYGAERGLSFKGADTEDRVVETLATLGIAPKASEEEETEGPAVTQTITPATPVEAPTQSKDLPPSATEKPPAQRSPSHPEVVNALSRFNALREKTRHLSEEQKNLAGIWREHGGFTADEQAELDSIVAEKYRVQKQMIKLEGVIPPEMLISKKPRAGAGAPPVSAPVLGKKDVGNVPPPPGQPPFVQLPVTDLEEDVHTFDPRVAAEAHMIATGDIHSFNPREAAEAHMIAAGDIHRFDPREAAVAHMRAMRETPTVVPILDTETAATEGVAAAQESQPAAPASPETRFEKALRKIHTEDPEKALRILNTVEGKSGPVREKFLKLIAASEGQKEKQETRARQTLSERTFAHVEKFGTAYKKLSFKKKIALGILLAGGVAGGAFAFGATIPVAFLSGATGRRIFGALAAGAVATVASAAYLERKHNKKYPGWERSEVDRSYDRKTALLMGVLASGGVLALGSTISHAFGAFQETEAGAYVAEKIGSLKGELSQLYDSVRGASGTAGASIPTPSSFPYTPVAQSPELAQAISGKAPIFDMPKPEVGAPITFTPTETTGAFDAEQFNAQLVEDMRKSLGGDTPSFGDPAHLTGASTESAAPSPEIIPGKIEVTVKPGNNLWNILKDELAKQHKLDGLSLEKQNYLIYSMKDKFAAMSPAQLREIGFKGENVNINLIHAGEKLDLSSVLGSGDHAVHAVSPAAEATPWIHEEMPNTPTPATVDVTGETAPIAEHHSVVATAETVVHPNVVPVAEPHSFPVNEPFFESDNDRLIRNLYGMSPPEAIADPVMGEHIRRAIGGVLNQVYSPHDGHVWVMGGATEEWRATKGLSAYQLIYRPEALTSSEFPDIGISEKTESLRKFARDIMQRTGDFPTRTETIEEYLRHGVAKDLLKRRHFGGL